MIKTLNNNIGLWPQSADDDDTCLNVNIVLWPQDVLTSLAQESPGEPRRAQESPGEPRRAQEGPGEPRRAQAGQVRSGQVRSGQVRSGQEMWFRHTCIHAYPGPFAPNNGH